MLDMKVTWKTKDVLEKLKANRAEHKAVVEEARDGYLRKARAALESRLGLLAEGKLVQLRFSLSPPQDMTQAYDTAIRMLEGHLDAGGETVELSGSDVRRLIMDEWDWADTWLLSNAHYSGKAASLADAKNLT